MAMLDLELLLGAAVALAMIIVPIVGGYKLIKDLFGPDETPERSTAPAPSHESVGKGAIVPLSGDAKSQDSAKRSGLLERTTLATHDAKPQDSEKKSGLLERATLATHKVAKALDDLDDFMTLQKEVDRATSELSLTIYKERALIKAAVEASKTAVDLENRLESDPVLRKHFNESQRKYDEIALRLKENIESTKGGSRPAPSIPELPSFDYPLRHPNSKIADAIQNKILSLKNERDLFLSEVVQEIWASEKLRRKVEEKLRKLGAFEIYKRLLLARVWENYVGLPSGGVLGPIRKRVEEELRRPDAYEIYAETSFGPVGTRQSQTDPFNPVTTVPLDETASEIRNRAETLGIPFLVHFTRAENLGSIMEHGLGSLTALKDKGIRPLVNDHSRYDGHPDAICLSIAHPNDKMFFKYRSENPGQDWVILVLDASTLWTHAVAFCRNNAADRRMSRLPLAERKRVSAFEAMFPPSDDLPSREKQYLKSYDPTDVQAELLVFDRISPELIRSLVVGSAHVAEKYKSCCGAKPISIHAEGSGFFSPRSYVRKSGWTYSAVASGRAVQWQQGARVDEPLSALERGKIKLTDVPF